MNAGGSRVVRDGSGSRFDMRNQVRAVFLTGFRQMYLKSDPTGGTVLATLVIRSKISQSLLASIKMFSNEQPRYSCISILNEHLLFSELCWNRLLFSELVWNISEFRIGFLIISCSFHFGVTVDFSIY